MTLKYSVLFIPLSLIVAYVIALLMSQDLRGISIYRTMWYLPSLVPIVASAVVWRWALNPEFGPVNYPLRLLGLECARVADRPEVDHPVGGLDPIVGIRKCRIDLPGCDQRRARYLSMKRLKWTARRLAKFWKITLPMTSSVIFFQVIMAVIASFQVFGVAYILI